MFNKRTTKKNRVENRIYSKYLKLPDKLIFWIEVSVAFVFLFLIFTATTFFLQQNEKEIRKDKVKVLSSVLNTTHNIAKNFQDRNMNDAKQWAANAKVIESTENLLKLDSDYNTLISAPPLKELRKFLNPLLNQYNYSGFFIISPNYISLASMRDENIGTINLIAREKKNRLKKVFKGEAQFIPTMHSDVPLLDKTGKLVDECPTMFVVVPIKNKTGEVIAALSIRLDPFEVFSEIMKSGIVGRTGETYIFNDDGILLSESRFEEQLRDIKLFNNIHTIEIRNPQVNLINGEIPPLPRSEQPLTYMAQNAMHNPPGYSTTAYRDYRGVPVIGTWLWNFDLGIGICTEIDESEVLEVFNASRMLIYTLFGISVVITFFFFIIMNIKHQRATRVLTQNQQYFSTILNKASSGIITLNNNGIIKTFNSKAEEIFGYSGNEVFEKDFSFLFTNSDTEDFFQNCFNNNNSLINNLEKEYIGLKKDGASFPISLEITKTVFDGSIVFIATTDDLTESKLVEDKLKKQADDLGKYNQELEKSRIAALSILQDVNLEKSKAEKALSDLEKSTLEFKKLSLAIEHAEVTVMITKPDGEIEYVNPYFYKSTGYSYEEVIGNNPRIFKSGNIPKEVYSDMWKTLTAGKIWKGEIQNKKKNGELHWESTTISPVLDSSGEISYFIAVREDITKKKELNSNLLIAKQEAEKATEAKSRFLATMSHEIRTPMNAIIGLSYLALNTPLDPKQLDYLTKIDSSARSLLKIINSILDFSKIEAGELLIENISFNLESVLDTVSNFISFKAYEKGLEFIISVADNVPLSLIGDPLRLGQILTNFCNNAVKFTNKGEIILKISSVLEDEKNVELLFEIKDTGIGIKEEEKDNLFKAFHQGDISTTRNYGGTGLGLVITENLAKLMNGNTWFKSEENKGSTFYYSGKFEKQKNQKKKSKAPFKELEGLQVLHCDSSDPSYELCKEKLGYFSFNVTSLKSLNEIIAEVDKSDENKFKLLIIDWRTIKLSGIDTFLKIREKYFLETPIIILATVTDMKYMELFIGEFENVSILLKPVLPSSLYNKVMDIFGKLGTRTIVISDKKNIFQKQLEKIRGAVILVAEDNEINQQVTIEMFEAIDIKVEIAENGLKAVEMVSNSGLPSKYSLILMDIQMPEMDGFEATHQIKKLENYKSIPIVAMTADAMTAVKEKCFEVGMVDYLTKPIEPERVLETLVKWIKPNKTETNYKTEPNYNKKKNEDRMEVELPAIDGINVNDGLRYVGGDKKLLINLLEKFLNNSDFEKKMNKALEEGDRELAIRLIHTLKGNAGLLGMNELKEVTDSAQNALLKDKNLDVGKFINGILVKLSPILNALKLLFVKEEEKYSIKYIEDVEDKLNELKSLLELHDSDAIELVNDIGSIIGFENEMVELKKTIENYQFEKGLEILLRIKNY
ncbi:MAG: PAS domain S-box protein [Melioribacteraceae bacterium]|nr:PAS domain S-box protein [Melioribacteraceae bacterium]